jgi:hypothetical protein
LDCDDLDAFAERVAHTRPDTRWQMPIVEIRPGIRACILEDPDGNAVELVENRL